MCIAHGKIHELQVCHRDDGGMQETEMVNGEEAPCDMVMWEREFPLGF